MEDWSFDYLKAYLACMLPQARRELMDMTVFQEYQAEKKRLGALAAQMVAQNTALADADFLLDVRKLEQLSAQVLEAAQRLDPYGDCTSTSFMAGK